MNIDFSNILVFFVALLLAMSFHEATHAFVSHWLGDTTAKEEGRLTLNPLKHIDLYTTILLPTVLVLLHLPPILAAKPVPFNPARVKYDEFGVALIGVAGPLSNLVLAFLAGLLVRLGGVSVATAGGGFLLTFIELNIGLFLFNMIPIPPLDGSRLLYAVAPEPVQRVMRSIESVGIFAIMIILLVLLPFLSPILSAASSALLRIILGG